MYKAKYYFVIQLKYGDVIDIFNFDTRTEMMKWKEFQKEFHGDNVEFIYTSFKPETWDEFESNTNKET